MRSVDSLHFTSFTFPITEKADRIGWLVKLTYADVQNLAQLGKRVLALCEFLPDSLQSEILSDGAQFLVRVASAPSALVALTPDEIHSICVNALSVLTGAATEITRNAERPEPRPLSVVSPNKRVLSLLKMLSSGSEETRPPATLRSQEQEYLLPILAPADFTSTDAEATQRKPGVFRIVGLIRGEEQGKHQFVLAGGLRVDLPKSPRWSWSEIHDVLDYEASVVGTLIRESAGDAWSVTDDTHVERQPPLF